MFNDLIMTKFSESTRLPSLRSCYCVVSEGCWDPEGRALPPPVSRLGVSLLACTSPPTPPPFDACGGRYDKASVKGQVSFPLKAEVSTSSGHRLLSPLVQI